MELGIKQLITVVLTLLVAVSLIGIVPTVNKAVNDTIDAQISVFTENYGVSDDGEKNPLA